MKPATKVVRGAVVIVVRRAELLDVPALHDRDAVGQGHRPPPGRGDVDDRVLEALVQLLDLTRISARNWASRFESGSSNRKTLDRARSHAHGDALALAAGELTRLPVEQNA